MSYNSSFFVKKNLISLMAFMALIALFDTEAICSLNWSLESKVTPKMFITFFEIKNFPLIYYLDSAITIPQGVPPPGRGTVGKN